MCDSPIDANLVSFQLKSLKSDLYTYGLDTFVKGLDLADKVRVVIHAHHFFDFVIPSKVCDYLLS